LIFVATPGFRNSQPLRGPVDVDRQVGLGMARSGMASFDDEPAAFAGGSSRIW
jgi:hypothetical protein